MTKQKLCSRHKQDIINDSNKKNGLTCLAKLDTLVKLVDSSKCDLCKLENSFNSVLGEDDCEKCKGTGLANQDEDTNCSYCDGYGLKGKRN